MCLAPMTGGHVSNLARADPYTPSSGRAAAVHTALAMPMHRLIGAPTSWGEPCQVF